MRRSPFGSTSPENIQDESRSLRARSAVSAPVSARSPRCGVYVVSVESPLPRLAHSANHASLKRDIVSSRATHRNCRANSAKVISARASRNRSADHFSGHSRLVAVRVSSSQSHAGSTTACHPSSLAIRCAVSSGCHVFVNIHISPSSCSRRITSEDITHAKNLSRCVCVQVFENAIASSSTMRVLRPESDGPNAPMTCTDGSRAATGRSTWISVWFHGAPRTLDGRRFGNTLRICWLRSMFSRISCSESSPCPLVFAMSRMRAIGSVPSA